MTEFECWIYTQYGPIKNQHSDLKKKEPVVRILGLKNRFTFYKGLVSEISGLMSGSCHIRRVEIVVELGIFVFF